jgi:hypothetical protein
MFAQFRHQYPHGSITAEIVEKVDGMHTFRAVVRSGDVILSTAFATDSSFERAEERAIERALARVGLESAYGHNYPPLLSQVTRETDSISGLSGSAPQLQAAPILREDRHDPAPSYPTSHQPLHSPKSYTPPATINGEILKEIPAPPLPAPIYSPNHHNSPPAPEISLPVEPQQPYVPAQPSKPPITSPAAPPVNSDPLDLSDAIAQIDVEMRRLNWSAEDGRDYLIRTFNKKSRQRLTPHEMGNFLNYLKSLPTPISHSFTPDSEDIF